MYVLWEFQFRRFLWRSWAQEEKGWVQVQTLTGKIKANFKTNLKVMPRAMPTHCRGIRLSHGKIAGKEAITWKRDSVRKNWKMLTIIVYLSLDNRHDQSFVYCPTRFWVCNAPPWVWCLSIHWCQSICSGSSQSGLQVIWHRTLTTY